MYLEAIDDFDNEESEIEQIMIFIFPDLFSFGHEEVIFTINLN